VNVAVVSGGSPDYLIDIVADGLIRLLGRGCVHLDYRIGGWNWDLRVTQLFEGFEGFNVFAAAEAECLITSTRVDCGVIDRWKALTGRTAVAVLDGEDDDVIREPFAARAKAYFKREYLRGCSYPAHVHPLPFAAIPEERMDGTRKTRPVFFRATATHPLRAAVADQIRALGFEVNGTALPKPAYNELLAASIVCPSVRGAGWDTYRYWEIPLFGGVLLSQKLPIAIADDFVDGEEALFFETIPEFAARLAWLLDHPADAERIARAGQQKSAARHLSIHRAATVLDALVQDP
jgi:hypothetical protein